MKTNAMSLLRTAGSTGLAAIAVSCGSGVEPPGTELIQTDRAEYQLRTHGDGLATEIPFTFTNRAGATVYVANCNGGAPPALEKRVNGEWIPAWSPVYLLCASPSMVIPPFATYSDTLHLSAPNPLSDYHPQWMVEEVPGTYRLVWHSVGFKEVALPLELRVSNPFRLATP